MNIIEPQLSDILGRNWWALLLRGLFAIIFGLFAWFQPGASIAAIVLLFGIYVLADGLLGVWTAVAGRSIRRHWWVLFLWGLFGIVAGVLAILLPAITVLALVIYIAAWALATGVLQIVAAIRLRKEIEGELLLGLGGIASITLGILLVMWPGIGALSLLWLVATYAFLFGIVLVLLALKLRRFGNPRATPSL